MRRANWETLYPFKWDACFKANITPHDTAVAVNRYWWSTQPTTDQLRKLHRRKS